MTRGRVALITGGARSGKSARAQALAAADGRAVAFLATAQATDDEFRRRIARHRQDRPAAWLTIEEPLQLAEAARRAWQSAAVLLIDDLGVWVANRLLAEAGDPEAATWPTQLERLDADLSAEGQRLTDGVPEGSRLILVTQETGWGVVPPYPLGRAFRDALGRLNQRVAATADEVTLMVAGIAVELKGTRR